jgi:hypothetical protein
MDGRKKPFTAALEVHFLKRHDRNPTPPEGCRCFPGGFLYPFLTPLLSTAFEPVQTSQFSLGFDTVAMPIYWLDVVHASITDAGLFGKFAFFLVVPD